MPDVTESVDLWTQWKLLVHRSRSAQIALMIVADAVVITAATGLAYYLRFEGAVLAPYQEYAVAALVAALIVYGTLLWVNGLYHIVLRYVGVDAFTRLATAVGIGLVLMFGVDVAATRLLSERPVPFGVVVIQGMLVFLGCLALRSVGRLWVVMTGAGSKGEHRVLIVGAGDAGSLLLRDIENQPQLGYCVVGFVDDADDKQNLRVRGAQILGKLDELPAIVERESVEEVLVAIPSMENQRRREVLELCTSVGIRTRIIGGIAKDAVSAGLADLRAVKIEDLLGREPNEVDVELISETLTGKVVAVTGAAGSIGSELCRQIMKMRPSQLILIEMDESRLYELFLEMEEVRSGVAIMRICDIRDDRKLHKIFSEERPQVVFHAAAYKHVPLMEEEPEEAIRANVLGTLNVLKSCNEVCAERFVLISTDKAVHPRNVMGATKAVAERVMLAAARGGVKAMAVRFGNVLGSRGSVVPIFEEQLRHGGPVKVTHPEVTRYFMTIPEAARLVLQAQAMSEGGDIFVLDMGEPVKIVDLAQRMIVLSGATTHIEFTGLRPGEKMHEILVQEDGDLLETECPAVVRLNSLPRILPEFPEMLRELITAARLGDSPDLKDMLCLLATAHLDDVEHL